MVAALNIYLIGMVFAALDYPLNFAFYARNNTLLPALVGVASVAVYTVRGAHARPAAWLPGAGVGRHGQAGESPGHHGVPALAPRRAAGGGNAAWVCGGGTGNRAADGSHLRCCADRRWVLPPTVLGTLTLIVSAAGAGVAVYAIFLFWRGQTEIRTIFERIMAR